MIVTLIYQVHTYQLLPFKLLLVLTIHTIAVRLAHTPTRHYIMPAVNTDDNSAFS